MKTKSSKIQICAIHKIHVYVLLIAVAIFFASCNSMSDKTKNSSGDSLESIGIKEAPNTLTDTIAFFLLDASARDFHKNQPPAPIGFRDVQIKYLTKPDGEKTYLICGQFLSQDNQNKDEWTYFVTIKTDPYEQWIGSNALTYCQDSKVITYTKIDLSVALKSRYDSLQKLSK